MERRGSQESNHNHQTKSGHRTGETWKTAKPNYKLELQSNSWLRIGLKARKPGLRFENLFSHLNLENFRQAYRALDGSKARGIDGVTKDAYGKDLENNLADLLSRLHKGTYRPQPRKRVLIPKANGKTRPIAISSFEDKLVEWVISKALSAIYEPSFIKTSYGFRERRRVHEALQTTYAALKQDKRQNVVEIDLASFFDTIPHRRLIKILQERICDQRFLSLISRFLTAGILEEGKGLCTTDTGAPQGSIMSPVLANIYLHHCLDSWFLQEYATKGGTIVRYADDAIFLFEKQSTATEFIERLKKRVELFGLKLNEDKSGMISFGKSHGNVFHFLGFTFFWGHDRRGSRKTLKIKTARKTIDKKIAEYQAWIKRARSSLRINEIWRITAAKLRGHYNYYGVTTNRPKLTHYYSAVRWSLFRWLNRRSQKRSMSWRGFQARLMQMPLPPPPDVSALVPLDLQRSKMYAY